VVKHETIGVPGKFSELSKYFLAGFDTFVESSYLTHPDQVLYLMARLAADFPSAIDSERLHFVEPTEVINPDMPFVAVGNFPIHEDILAPVRFDQGHVTVRTPKGETYFDISNLDDITVAEIVKAPTSYGLWISPSKNPEMPVSDRLELAQDNVAFIDAHGVIKTLDSSEPSLAAVYYPDVEEWFDVLGKYKFWLMVGLWFLLTMIIVYLYRVTQSNKANRDEDDVYYQNEEAKTQAAIDQMDEPVSDSMDYLKETTTDHIADPMESMDHMDSMDHLDERK